MQADLRRLAHGADEQQQAQRGDDVDVQAEEREGLAVHPGHRPEHVVEAGRVEHQEDAENA